MQIKLLISDFDGTLVDTFESNYLAYHEAFASQGLTLTREHYRNCFGMRFDDFMAASGITSEKVKEEIRHRKGECYPSYFSHLKVNHTLLNFIKSFHASGGKTAIASTARRKNLINALTHIDAISHFDLVLAGEDVSHGKPNPEIYLKALQHFGYQPEEALVFEDSEVGCTASLSAHIPYIRII